MNIAGYRIERLIGKGGMAAVYLAIQESLGRPVALKVLNPSFSDTPEFSERFLNEGRILAALNHPNIITIHDIGIANGFHYISMEHVEGGDLRSRITEGMSATIALGLLQSMGGCLRFAHDKGIIHRDVKPANILFRKDDTPLLTDFGIAKQLRGASELTLAGTVLGSPHYLSPEQADGRVTDGRADIYSLGIIFYEMLTRQRPYEGDSDISTILKHREEPVPELPSHLAPLQSLLNRMIAKEPEERFGSVSEILEAITDLREAGRQPAANGAPAPENKLSAETEGAAGAAQTEEGQTLVRRRLVPAQKWPAIAVGLASFIFAAIVVNTSLDFAEEEEMVPVMQTAPGSVPGQRLRESQPVPPSGEHRHGNRASAKQQPASEEVKRLLALATEALAQNRLLTPREQSAYFFYKRARELEPENVEVELGIRHIADRYAALAANLMERHHQEEARAYIRRGLEVHPTSARLQALQLSNSKTLDKVHALNELARRALADNRLTAPSGDNALHYYREMQRLDRKSRVAKAGFDGLVDRFVRLAKKRVDEQDYAQAQSYIAHGLKIDPNNAKLRKLRDYHSRLLSRMGELKLLAMKALKENRLTQPAEDNAFDYYRRLRKFDVEAANTGFAEIAERYALLAEGEISKYRYTKARRLIDRGLEVQPANRRLLTLREKANIRNAPRQFLKSLRRLSSN
jgi:serine/threonine-protein kinase PpkA